MSRRPAQPFLLFLFGGLLLATALPTDAATLTLSQQPLFLTEGVAPNIMVTIDNSNSMRWSFAPDGLNPTTNATYNGYTADQIRTSRRAKSSTFNPLYYNPNVTYQAPYNVLYSNAVTTYTPLTTSFTAAYVNGFKSAKGSLDLSSAYKVSWEYDTARATTDSTYWTYTGYSSYSSPDKVYYLAANPSSDFSSSSTSSSTSSTSSVSGSTTSTGKSASLTGGGTYTVTAKSNSCTATITNPKSSTGSTTTNSDGSTSSTTTAVSYSTASCSYTTSGKTTTYTVTSTATTTLTTTTTYPDRTKTAVPAYYYVYNTALSGCTSSINDDNCYKLVTVSSTSGANGGDERQNFANWYSFYRNRELATQSGANLAFVTLPENTRCSWQALGTSDTCITSSSYLSSYNCRGLSNTSTSYYDNRLGTFSGAHRAKLLRMAGGHLLQPGHPAAGRRRPGRFAAQRHRQVQPLRLLHRQQRNTAVQLPGELQHHPDRRHLEHRRQPWRLGQHQPYPARRPGLQRTCTLQGQRLQHPRRPGVQVLGHRRPAEHRQQRQHLHRREQQQRHHPVLEPEERPGHLAAHGQLLRRPGPDHQPDQPGLGWRHLFGRLQQARRRHPELARGFVGQRQQRLRPVARGDRLPWRILQRRFARRPGLGPAERGQPHLPARRLRRRAGAGQLAPAQCRQQHRRQRAVQLHPEVRQHRLER
ncbi:MAG: hypothetical protein QM805_09430 [Pseudomonas sp.]